jgi:hypothetical protein
VKCRTFVRGILVLTWLLTLPAWAVEYRLQVTNIDALTFSSYMEQATQWWCQNEPMGRLEARLYARQFPLEAVLPGREVQLLEDPALGAKCRHVSLCYPPPDSRPGPRSSGMGIRGTPWPSW